MWRRKRGKKRVNGWNYYFLWYWLENFVQVWVDWAVLHRASKETQFWKATLKKIQRINISHLCKKQKSNSSCVWHIVVNALPCAWRIVVKPKITLHWLNDIMPRTGKCVLNNNMPCAWRIVLLIEYIYKIRFQCHKGERCMQWYHKNCFVKNHKNCSSDTTHRRGPIEHIQVNGKLCNLFVCRVQWASEGWAKQFLWFLLKGNSRRFLSFDLKWYINQSCCMIQIWGIYCGNEQE